MPGSSRGQTCQELGGQTTSRDKAPRVPGPESGLTPLWSPDLESQCSKKGQRTDKGTSNRRRRTWLVHVRDARPPGSTRT